LNYIAFIPAWPVFITWACFFHLDGGINKNQAFFATVRHIGLGAFSAWVSALLLLNNPFNHAFLATLWGPLLIALVIAVLMRLSTQVKFSVTPAIIYGYAIIWAFLSLPNVFTQTALTSLSFQNAFVVIYCCVLLGASAAYLNAMMVEALCNMRIKGFSQNPTNFSE